jgi:DNA-binding response OmpR family regulator
MKVALLEDNPAIIEMMETALDMQEYGGEPCASGETLFAALLASRGEQGNGHGNRI